MPASCIVTGASGYLGRVVLRKMSACRDAVGIAREHSSPSLIRCDLTDPADVRNLISRSRPDLFVHCAAWRDPDRCEEFPDAAGRINRESVRFICEWLPPEAKLVLISSDYVFDGKHPPYRETDPVSPVNVYGRTKAEAEDIALARGNSLVVRCPLLVGHELEGMAGFIAKMAASIRSGSPDTVDDVLVRYPVFGPDVAAAIAFLLDRGASGIFHVSGREGGTVWCWTRRTASLIGLPDGHLHPSKEVVPRRAARPPDSHLSNEKICSLGFDRFTGFDEVVKKTLPLLKRFS